VLFPKVDDSAIFVGRSDPHELLGTHSIHPFKLDGREWMTVEHYFQAKKFETTSLEHFEAIRNSSTAKLARKLGRSNKNLLREDWSIIKRIVMTRAFYTKCRTHSEVAAVLIESEDKQILDNSQYDYYWGCGRDKRAQNIYGNVLMDVRKKLQNEALVLSPKS